MLQSTKGLRKRRARRVLYMLYRVVFDEKELDMIKACLFQL